MDIKIICDDCGNELDFAPSEAVNEQDTCYVSPCEHCMKVSRGEGYDEGYYDGYKERC